VVVSTVNYLLRTDVHTFAFSVAANSILSFFPFRRATDDAHPARFPFAVMYNVVVELLRDYLPAGQEFVIRNLNAMVNSRHSVQVVR
jgi:membrane protein